MLSEPQYIWDNGKKIWMISTKKINKEPNDSWDYERDMTHSFI